MNPKQPVTPRNRRRPLAALAATAATLLVAGGYVFANQQLARVNAQIKLQTDQQEKLQRSLAAADDVSHEYQALADWNQGSTDCLAELRRLSAEYVDTRQIHLLALTVTPDAAPDGAHRIMLDGAARSEMLIAEFHTKLNRSGHYSAQLIGAVQADGRGGDYRYSFKTSLTVRPRAAAAPSPLGERAGE